MPQDELQAANPVQAAPFKVAPPKHTPNRRVVTVDRRSNPAQESLEEILSSALRSADGELGQLLQEVDAISKSLKLGMPDPQMLRAAAHPAVWYAVKHALMDRELRHLALTDELTCLYNRRGFFAAAVQQLRQATRKGQNLLLLYCDVDNLKKINDSFGHREGDLALIHAADALEHAFRNSDILARLGGDEFVVLAPEASVETQDMLLRRLEKCLKNSHPDKSRYQLSLSVGVARFVPKHAVSLGELMAQADEAMYEQKRNRQKSFNSNSWTAATGTGSRK